MLVLFKISIYEQTQEADQLSRLLPTSLLSREQVPESCRYVSVYCLLGTITRLIISFRYTLGVP